MSIRMRGLGLILLIATVGRARAESPVWDARLDTPLEVVGPVTSGINVDSLQRLGLLDADGAPRRRGAAPKRDDAPPAVAVDGSWTVLPPPSSRYGHVSIVDPKRGRLLAIGGLDGEYPQENSVWSFDLVTMGGWSRIEIEGDRPAIRHQATAIYDPVGHRAIVHGGFLEDGFPFGDTWALSLDDPMRWSRIEATNAPPARMGHSATYDPLRHRMLMIGGLLEGGFSLDVYELSLGPSPQWRLVTTHGDARPVGRFQHTTTYDPVQDRIILYGGAATDFLGDVWELSLAGPPTWSEILPNGTRPGPRRHHRAEYDAVGRRLIMVGGDPARPDDAWQLSLAGDPEWRPIPTQGEASEPRWAQSMAYDDTRGRMLMFGGLGLSRSMFNDLWSLELSDDPRWSLLGAPGPPGVQGGSAFVDDSGDHMVLLSGFRAPVGHELENDVWIVSLADAWSWSQRSIGLNPLRSDPDAGVVQDTREKRLIALRGTGDHLIPTLTLESLALDFDGFLDEGGAWQRVVQHRAGPPGRSGHMTVYDPVRHRVLIHGGVGRNTQEMFGDMWELRLETDPVWVRLTPQGEDPAARFRHTALFDGARNRVLVLGGLRAIGHGPVEFVNDVWEVSLEDSPRWTRLQPAGDSPGDISTRAILDTRRDRVLLFGYNLELERNELWELALSPALQWRRLEVEGEGPITRFDPVLAIDPYRDRLIVYMTGIGQAYEVTWHEAPAVTGPAVANDAVARAPTAARASPAGDVLRFHATHRAGAVEAEIRVPSSGELSVEIFDVAGRRVASRSLAAAGPGMVRWRSGGLAAGVYIVRLRQGQATRFHRVLVL